MALVLKSTEKTPTVRLDSETGIFIFSGVILPEDTLLYFNPILNYCSDYLKKPEEVSVIKFYLNYFNTSASRMIFNMLKLFGDAQYKTNTVVEWYFEDDDLEMEEVCDEFMEMVQSLKFIKKPIPSGTEPEF